MSPDRRRPGPLPSPGRQTKVTTTVGPDPTPDEWREGDIGRLLAFASLLDAAGNGDRHWVSPRCCFELATGLRIIALRLKNRAHDDRSST